MGEIGASQLLVFDNDKRKVVGGLTEKGIMEKMGATSRDFSKQPVEKIMGKEFPSVSDDTPVSIISILLHYEPAVVLTRNGNVSGIVTKSDLLKVLS